MTSRLLLLSATGALALLPGLSPPPPALAVPGPGGVILTVNAYLDAIDRGDTAALQSLIGSADSSMCGPVRVEQKAGGEPHIVDVERPAALFSDVGPTGRASGATPAEWLRELRKCIAAGDGRTVHSEVRAIHAACPSPTCSYAVVEFDRRYRQADGTELTVPLRATALVRYDADRPHDFAIFHWHASRR